MCRRRKTSALFCFWQTWVADQKTVWGWAEEFVDPRPPWKLISSEIDIGCVGVWPIEAVEPNLASYTRWKVLRFSVLTTLPAGELDASTRHNTSSLELSEKPVTCWNKKEYTFVIAETFQSKVVWRGYWVENAGRNSAGGSLGCLGMSQAPATARDCSGKERTEKPACGIRRHRL